MSEFDQVEWEAPYEFPPGPKPMLLEAESPEAGKFGPLHVFAVVPLDAAEKAFEAGVQAERERFERQFMESLLTRRAAPSWILGREPSKPLNEDNLTGEQEFWLDVRAALAVVTGKEGEV